MTSLLATLALAPGLMAPAEDRTGQAFLYDLSQRAFDFFWERSHPKTGFTLDRARNWGPTPDKNRVASIATTGFALAAYAIGAERGWIEKEEAVERTTKTLQSLIAHENLRVHGWFYHWFDWETGERAWNSEISTIDTGIFLSGMILNRQGLRDEGVNKLADKILSEVDWHWALTDDGAKPKELFISHGWRPEEGFLQWRWAGYCELLLLYVLAYGSYPDMPAASWSSIEKPLVKYKNYEFYAGGPLFLHQMSHVFFDFRDRRDPKGIDYWVASRNAILANRQYCIDNPKAFDGYGPKVWGLSAADYRDGYVAFGAPGWTEDNGTIAPSSAVAAAMFAPAEAVEAAETIAKRYPWTLGRYGFTISFNPTETWKSPDVIGIDLGQMLLSIENLRDGLPNRLVMSHPVSTLGYERIGLKITEEGNRLERPLVKR
ncbi:MAG: hypothetical protein KIT11_01560 [Fimbriimonadaceae bacterium]|nr:hypothetical protein [Fimbriimonadaceae bacterium]QYK54943.1 MAG: hypothetical protein KF733_07975 [Fimbriimonadaceae bacterium]